MRIEYDQKFQFHTGSIKRIRGITLGAVNSNMFQFHTGSIKREVALTLNKKALKSFNSILVRLKVDLFIALPSSSACFNSILVRLKAVPARHGDMLLLRRFNSILVRLKVWRGVISKVMSISFNSILVRLKGCVENRDCRYLASFNSILVRLKVWNCFSVIFSLQIVSIPYWFD